MVRAGIHDYSTPKGEFHKIKSDKGEVSFEIKWNTGFGPKLSRTFNTVQEFVDTKCLNLCAPMVPKDANILIESGILNTQIGSGEIKYRTPYARRWYYMPANFSQGDGEGINAVGRGNYWFYRMKEQYREQILTGAKRVSKRLMGG